MRARGDGRTLPTSRVFVVSYYFPPAGAAGSLRILSFATHLLEFGWLPSVVTPGSLGVVFEDESLVSRIDPRVEILRCHRSLAGSWALRKKSSAPASEPKAESGPASPPGLRRRIRSAARRVLDKALALPDHAVLWSIAAGWTVGRLMREGASPVVLTTSPPHSTLLSGLVAKTTGRGAWVADLRDPWSSGDRGTRGSLRNRVGHGLELAALRHADAVLANTEPFADYLRRLDPSAAGRIVTVPNGYDEDAVSAALAAVRDRPKSEAFVIVHAGALYRGLREPLDVIDAIGRLRGQHGIQRPIRLVLPGDSAFHHDSALRRRAEALGGAATVECPGYRPHQEVLELMASADLLLLIQGHGFPMQIPSKAYEYLAMGRPVLAVTPPGATADLVRTSPHGVVVEPGDTDAIAARLLELVTGSHRPREVAAARPIASRRELSRRLADVLSRAVLARGR